MSDPATHTELPELRRQLQSADQELILALFRRYQLVQQIGTLKCAEKLPVVQPDYWNLSFNRQLEFARSLGLPDEWTSQVLNLLHDISIHSQQQISIQHG